MRKEQAFDSRRKILQEKTRRSTSFYFGSFGINILFFIALSWMLDSILNFSRSWEQEKKKKIYVHNFGLSGGQQQIRNSASRPDIFGILIQFALDSCSCSTLKIFFYLWSKLCCKSDITCLAQRFSTVGHILHGKVIFAV